MNFALATIALSAAIFAASSAPEISFADLPKTAQVAINRNLDGGAVHTVVREAREGRTIYVVGIRHQGHQRQLRISADGKVLPETAVGAPGGREQGSGSE